MTVIIIKPEPGNELVQHQFSYYVNIGWGSTYDVHLESYWRLERQSTRDKLRMVEGYDTRNRRMSRIKDPAQIPHMPTDKDVKLAALFKLEAGLVFKKPEILKAY